MYTVKILPEAEFNKLPFKLIQERPEDIMGASDVKTGVAYVKDTGYNDITKATIQHELDELMAKTSSHEIEGIRYKDIGQLAGNVFGGIKNVAQPIASGIGGIAKGIGGGIAKGASALGNVFKPSNLNASGGVFDKIKSGASNVLGAFGGGGTGSPTPSGALGAFGQAPNIGGGGLTNPFGTGGVFSGGGAQNTKSGGFNVGSILDAFGGKDTLAKIAGPAALNIAGNLFAPKVDTPDFSGVTNRLNSQITNGADPALRDVATGALKDNILGGFNVSEAGQLSPDILARINEEADRNLERDTDSLRNQFKARNPNANVEGNSAFLEAQQDLLQRDRESRQQLVSQTELENSRQAHQAQIQEIGLALNLDQSQINQYQQLAQLEVSEIMLKTGISLEEANQIKQLFGNSAEALLQSNFSSEVA